MRSIIWDDPALTMEQIKQWDREGQEAVSKGDVPGHEFHGNQWSGGGTSGTEHGVPIANVSNFDQLQAVMGMPDQDPKGLFPERYQDRSGGLGILSLKPGAIETQVGRDAENNPILYDRRGAFPFDEKHVVGSDRPLPYVFRVMSEEEFQNAAKNGYIKSDERMNLTTEGTVASSGSTGAFYMAPGANRVVRIDLHPEDGWKVDPRDEYIKTPNAIPFDRVSMVSPPIVKTGDDFSIQKGDVPGHPFHGNQWGESRAMDALTRMSPKDESAMHALAGGDWFHSTFDRFIGSDKLQGLREVTGERFHAAIQAAVNDKAHGAFLSNYSPEDYNHMRTFLAEDGKVGGALKSTPDGHQEIVSLFNAGGSRGAGLKMLDELVSRGGDRLDCIGDGLRGMYEAHGFKVTETIGWDDKYAPAGWDYRAYGRPHVYVMEHG